MLEFIKDARNANPRLTFGGAILTKHDGRQKICKIVAGAVKDYYGCVLESSIPPTNSIVKAQAAGNTILQYDGDDPVSHDFKQMALEIMAITGLAAKEPVLA
ncbi:cellulose biosynthesis protein BcsQ [Paraburkholderia bannensis]|uniref:Cellulose biosynthesis protein BcsQ n=1 Tax=Paraburkholderia bannensis TaxID=765414 RepID=A0A7W9U388_9BURK|nr:MULTISPECIES: hypothetical protein [Paraburkholderia]MBB3261195.1 cellulose biosynthesis protein BcsQ [Paraburkholderia sp. WP4_3_2]MBB6106232.1 cellulose biosynthesis protein BcsQ [Paraburkholderia bannensis]